MEVEKVVESLGRVRVRGTQRRTLLEVGDSRIRWLFTAIDASTPRITLRFLNVHLLFLLVPDRLALPPVPPPLSPTGKPPPSASVAPFHRVSPAHRAHGRFPFRWNVALRCCVIDTPRWHRARGTRPTRADSFRKARGTPRDSAVT